MASFKKLSTKNGDKGCRPDEHPFAGNNDIKGAPGTSGRAGGIKNQYGDNDGAGTSRKRPVAPNPKLAVVGRKGRR
jgi:hypothetical protein